MVTHLDTVTIIVMLTLVETVSLTSVLFKEFAQGYDTLFPPSLYTLDHSSSANLAPLIIRHALPKLSLERVSSFWQRSLHIIIIEYR